MQLQKGHISCAPIKKGHISCGFSYTIHIVSYISVLYATELPLLNTIIIFKHIPFHFGVGIESLTNINKLKIITAMETFTDDTVVALASFLSPHDMLSLALTCKRFGDKNGTDNKKRLAAREEDTSDVRPKNESISLVEVAARTVLFALATENERNALPKRLNESWIGLYQEFLSVFRLPLQFDKLVGGSVDYVEDTDKTKVCTKLGVQPTYNTVICSNIMRTGKHSVTFQVNDPSSIYSGISCGIIRPTTNDITVLLNCSPVLNDLWRFSLKEYEMLHSNNVDCCLTSMANAELVDMDEEQREQAERQNRNQPFIWDGQEETKETSFKIGMVLDLDEGTLDVYKNDRRLGTMMTGLVGEYCWCSVVEIIWRTILGFYWQVIDASNTNKLF